MGVYSNIATLESNVTLDFDFDSVEESCYEPDMSGAYAIVAEAMTDYNAIMKEIGINELAVLENTGAEIVYEAADIAGFFAKIKKFFMAFLAKVAALIKKFISIVDSWVRTDKSFLAKYRSKISNYSGALKYDGYNFTHTSKGDLWDAAKAYDSGETEVTNSDKFARVVSGGDMSDADYFASINEQAQDMDKMAETFRGKAIGKGGTIGGADFAKEVFKYFRSGEEDKKELSVKPDYVLSVLADSAKLKADAKKSYANFEKITKKEIANLKKQEDAIKKLSSSDDAGVNGFRSKALAAAGNMAKIARMKMGICNLVNGGLLSAMKAENRQARSMAVKMINPSAKTESAGVEYYSESTIGGVVLK